MMENKISAGLQGASLSGCEKEDNANSILSLYFNDKMELQIFSKWRLEHGEEIVVTATDALNLNCKRLLTFFQPVINRKVLRVSFSPQLDLTIEMEDGYKIRTFSDISYAQTENGND